MGDALKPQEIANHLPETNVLNKYARDLGIYWRAPTTKFQRIIRAFFQDYAWCRRLLGGRWELVIHDKGTLHYVLIWFWVEKWNTNKNGYRDAVIGREFYRKGIKQKFDFGDEWYAKQPKPLGDKRDGEFDTTATPKSYRDL